MMAGSKTAPKTETPKPLVDAIGEPKPAESAVPKVAEKPEIKPIPKEEPAEQKPPEPKPMEPVVEKKPPAKVEPKTDPIAEALKKEDAKKSAEAKAKAAAEKKKKPQLAFDPDQISALLDKRDPQRQAATGDTINKEPSLGTTTGSASTLSQSEIDALRSRLAQLWNPPAGALNPQDLVVRIRVKTWPRRQACGAADGADQRARQCLRGRTRRRSARFVSSAAFRNAKARPLRLVEGDGNHLRSPRDDSRLTRASLTRATSISRFAAHE